MPEYSFHHTQSPDQKLLSPYQLLSHFEYWRKNNKNTSPDQLEDELISLIKETKLDPDVYDLFLSDGKIVTKEGFPVEKAIGLHTEVEKREHRLYKKLEEWVSKNNGVAIWVSPPHEERSTFTKIIAHEVGNSVDNRFDKKIKNTSLLFPLDVEFAKEVFNRLSLYSFTPNVELFDPEEIRQTLLVLTEKDWVKTLETCIGKNSIIDSLKNMGGEYSSKFLREQIAPYKQMIIDGYNSLYIVQQMQEAELLGKYAPSCSSASGAFSDTLSALSNHCSEGKHVKNCGNCGVSIDAWIPNGYMCPSCKGVYKGC